MKRLVFVFFILFVLSLPVQAQSNCPYKRWGDANCDNQLTAADFTIWTDEYLKKLTSKQADFSDDTAISLVDLEILIRASLRGLPVLSGTPAPTSVNTPTPIANTGTITPTGVQPTTVAATQTPVPSGMTVATPTVAIPTGTPVPSNATLPAQVLNLTNWKVTLPIAGKKSPEEIEQDSTPVPLSQYKNDPWFIVATDKNGTGVRFRAPVTGVTTSGSGYPRSELREMINGGLDQASWSSTSGVHTMTIDQAITHVPKIKQHVVAGQIHDGGDDVIVIRLEGTKLFVDINGADGPVLTNNYILGTRFTVKFEVSNGQTRIYYNGSRVNNTGTNTPFALVQNYSGAYFKAGAYTQSNCNSTVSVEGPDGKETEVKEECSAANYGEVMIYGLSVTHQ